MNAWHQAFALTLLAALATSAAAQPIDELAEAAAYGVPQPIAVAPIFEGSVRKNRGIHIPYNVRTKAERQFSVGYTASNSYSNLGLLVCADRSCELEYQSDHTGNLLHLSYRQPILRAFELGFRVATYQMNAIPDWSPLHQFAGDDFLRMFHEDILGEDSLPVLSGAPDGRQIFTMTDLDGRRLTLEPEHFYRLPLQLDLTRYVSIRETLNAQMSLNFAAHLAFPIENDLDTSHAALARGIDFGLAANLIRARRVSDNVTSTFHLQLARFRNDVHVANRNSARHGDDLTRSQYAFSYGLRFAGTFGGRAPCSLGLTQVANSAHYDQERYWTWDRLVFEGGDNLRGANLSANDYGVVSFACEFRSRHYQIAFVEDIAGLSQLLLDDGSGTSYDPDFAVGLTVTFVPGSRRLLAD